MADTDADGTTVAVDVEKREAVALPVAEPAAETDAALETDRDGGFDAVALAHGDTLADPEYDVVAVGDGETAGVTEGAPDALADDDMAATVAVAGPVAETVTVADATALRVATIVADALAVLDPARACVGDMVKVTETETVPHDVGLGEPAFEGVTDADGEFDADEGAEGVRVALDVPLALDVGDHVRVALPEPLTEAVAE